MPEEKTVPLEGIRISLTTVISWAALVLWAITSWFLGETLGRITKLEAETTADHIELQILEDRQKR